VLDDAAVGQLEFLRDELLTDEEQSVEGLAAQLLERVSMCDPLVSEAARALLQAYVERVVAGDE
jgi:hypothetical protein